MSSEPFLQLYEDEKCDLSNSEASLRKEGILRPRNFPFDNQFTVILVRSVRVSRSIRSRRPSRWWVWLTREWGRHHHHHQMVALLVTSSSSIMPAGCSVWIRVHIMLVYLSSVCSLFYKSVPPPPPPSPPIGLMNNGCKMLIPSVAATPQNGSAGGARADADRGPRCSEMVLLKWDA